MKNRFIAVFLTVILAAGLLAGCTGTGSEDETESTAETEAQTDDSSDSEDTSSDTAALPDEAVEDVVYYLTDGTLSADDILFTIDGVDVTAAYYLYWVTYEAYLYSQTYYNSYYVYPEITQEFSDGTSMADLVLNYAYTYMVSYVCAYARALEDGVELSGDYLEAYETYYDESVYELGEEVWESAVYYGYISEDDYTDEEKDALIEAYGEYQMLLYVMYYSTTYDGIDDLYYYSNYFNQYRDYLFLEGGEYELSDEDIDDYIEEYDLYACDYIFVGNSTSSDITDEEFEEYEALAQEYADEINSLSGSALEEAIEEYATGSMCFGSSSELIEDSAQQLAEIEVGQAVVSSQTEYGYYVLIREEVTKDTIITELEYSVEISVAEMYFESLVSDWMDEAQITDTGLLDDFDIYTFYENLEDLRDIIDEVD